MINNKQVNIWRGSDTPPTKYHLWVTPNWGLWLYDDTVGVEAWVPFITNAEVSQQLTEALLKIDSLLKNTVNGIKVIDNPVLDATNIQAVVQNGTYINNNDNVHDALVKIDKLLDIQIIQ